MRKRKFNSWITGRQKIEFFPAPYRAPLRSYAVLVFVWHEDKVLVCDIQDRGWCVPGGKVEPQETSRDAARREALEEGGVILDQLIYIGCYRLSSATPNEKHVRWADAFTANIESFVDIIPNAESKGRKLTEITSLPASYYMWNELLAKVFAYSKEILERGILPKNLC